MEEEEWKKREEKEELHSLMAERRSVARTIRSTSCTGGPRGKGRRGTKKKLPRTSSNSSSGRARRRLRQWHARLAGVAGDVSMRAVFPSVVGRSEMLGIMARMDLKYSPQVWFAHRRLWQWHVQVSFFFLALCSLWLKRGKCACHFGWYGPEGQLRSFGFAGDSAYPLCFLRCRQAQMLRVMAGVFLHCRQAQMLFIMAGMDQKDS